MPTTAHPVMKLKSKICVLWATLNRDNQKPRNKCFSTLAHIMLHKVINDHSIPCWYFIDVKVQSKDVFLKS